jgi:hypothetical protein
MGCHRPWFGARVRVAQGIEQPHRRAGEPFLGSHVTDRADWRLLPSPVLRALLTDTKISCMLLKHYIVHVGLLAILEGRLTVLAEATESSD